VWLLLKTLQCRTGDYITDPSGTSTQIIETPECIVLRLRLKLMGVAASYQEIFQKVPLVP
jgi:hypothetical protein